METDPVAATGIQACYISVSKFPSDSLCLLVPTTNLVRNLKQSHTCQEVASRQRQGPQYSNHSPRWNLIGHREGTDCKLVQNSYRTRTGCSSSLVGPLTNRTRTLFIAYRMSKDPVFEGLTWTDILQKAWVAQLTGVPSILGEADIDRECLEQLEEEMLERTD